MSRLELLDFQQEAADAMVESALSYFSGTPDVIQGRQVPFIGQLKAVTGAGKTPILATTIGRIKPAIVLWTTKYGTVVDQTLANLAPGGKYHHLLGGGDVEIVKFTELPSYAAWQRILERPTGLTILVSTVAAWNSSEKDDRLNVHRIHQDWGQTSRWQQLKTERKRPLWVVYDEAHNTTTDQVELLDDLNPTGFFVATASPVSGKLQYYLTFLSQEQRSKRIVAVSTRAVVEAQLLKSVISVADYDSAYEEMVRDAAERRSSVENGLRRARSTTTPKAIYVVESSNSAKGAVSRPAAIWNVLTGACSIPPNAIAVCTNTKGLPAQAVQVKSLAQLSDEFTHIIFNKRLQEGWDDPAVCVCYFDGETTSGTRIQQVIGRALRQPEGRHFSNEDLNTAFFFVNCPSDALEGIVDSLREELRVYKGSEEPDDFEPFEIKEERKRLERIPLRAGLSIPPVPRLQLELPTADHLQKLLKKKTYAFSAEDCAAPGRAMVHIVSLSTGDVKQQSRDLFEDMRIGCGRYLQDQIRTRSKNCCNSMDPALFSNAKLNLTACFGSKALLHYHELAGEIVREYENHVRLGVVADPEEQLYAVEPYQPSSAVMKEFSHAAHKCYDAKSFNADELEMAKALDKSGYVWARNKDRLDYAIPLPLKSAASSNFYPDFLWWVKSTVWAIDPTGRHILDEKIRTKLLAVPPPLRIALVTRGRLAPDYKTIAEDGWTLLRLRMGNAAPEVFDGLSDVVQALSAETAEIG